MFWGVSKNKNTAARRRMGANLLIESMCTTYIYTVGGFINCLSFILLKFHSVLISQIEDGFKIRGSKDHINPLVPIY